MSFSIAKIKHNFYTSYVRLYFQLFFQHDGANPNITDNTEFEILRVPPGKQERLFVNNNTRIYKMIPENCKNLFNNIKYFYEHKNQFQNDKYIFSVEEMFDILTMTESGINKKYLITTLENSGLVDFSYYLVIDGQYVHDGTLPTSSNPRFVILDS